MSILDMKHHHSSSVDVATDQEFDALVAQGQSSVVTAAVSQTPTTGVASRVARFFAALRRSSTFSTGGAAFADHRIYEEYRASLARRDREHEVALQK